MSALEDAIGLLVLAAPELEPAIVEAAARLALDAARAATDAPALAHLALAIERVVDDLGRGDIALGVGLPALAMAATTLAQALEAGGAYEPLAIDGAIYELETLLPVPSTGRRPTVDEPKIDVPLEKLSSRAAAPARPVDPAATARAARLAADDPPALLRVRDRYTRGS